MDSFLDAIKACFSGIANLKVFLGLCGAFLFYNLISFVIVVFEDREFTVKLLATIQLKLGSLNNKLAKYISRWLWVKIIDLDYENRCQMALHLASEEARLWIISQFANFEYHKVIESTCRIIMSDPQTPEKIAKAAKISEKKMRHYLIPSIPLPIVKTKNRFF